MYEEAFQLTPRIGFISDSVGSDCIRCIQFEVVTMVLDKTLNDFLGSVFIEDGF